jgi:NAD dependent epimerase/dehydratase family enzyme
MDRSAMRIFLTGATGYVGSAVLDALVRAGHEVTALVRDPEKGDGVGLRGVKPIMGELSKPASYVAQAEACMKSRTRRLKRWQTCPACINVAEFSRRSSATPNRPQASSARLAHSISAK